MDRGCDNSRGNDDGVVAAIAGGVAAEEVGISAVEVPSLAWLCWPKVVCVDFSKSEFLGAPSVWRVSNFAPFLGCHLLIDRLGAFYRLVSTRPV